MFFYSDTKNTKRIKNGTNIEYKYIFEGIYSKIGSARWYEVEFCKGGRINERTGHLVELITATLVRVPPIVLLSTTQTFVDCQLSYFVY